ncbi:MAG: HI0074 family nucleotidyltransferase substrate-binding subunit [Candidatus Dojkabacteria bacterium]
MDKTGKKTQNLEQALESLLDAIEEFDGSDYMRDAVIKRFEYTFELGWKLMQAILQDSGEGELYGRRDIIRKAASRGLITQEEAHDWLDLLEAKNLTSHTYNEDLAEEVSQQARQLPKLAKSLLDKASSYKSE